MSVIAVAGGTGGVGKTIVEVLAKQPTYQVIVLTRHSVGSDAVGHVNQVQVDYNNITGLVQILEQHTVHTIISAIGLFDDATSQSQLNLIQAADQSKTTKRFIPSEYSFIQTKELLSVDPSIQHWLNAADSLKKSSLQYTRVIPGFFMDYWGMPPVRTNLQPVTFGIDMVSCQAAIPGDGNDVIGMTYTYDMAEFLVKLLELEEWPEFSIFVGDDVTYNELLRLAEEVRGKKFQVTYDSVENVKQGPVTVPPMPSGVPYSADELREMTVLVSRLTVAGVFDLPVEQRMNSRFPDLRPIKVKEFLLKAWKDFE
ncbi:predicted protein [Aspergillus terreus NIH2624]|uniref:NmrA-like domain-containing protein n=1 Tax=Aspergillus terreus (strain NIH 2624 / FGSC A1156) TaxID=341663 RepID=Q0CZ27_ASPTN|nr:uncharacterized protein ATEG_01057 [Aspergillus terreus NIH2624]EAU37814.1 predicted protein [Aspergillus terreus NIH2624]